MMKSLSHQLALCAMVTLAVMLLCDTRTAEAACTVTELSPCVGAITSGSPPSSLCCSRLKAQKPCLCGYLKDPNLKQYVNSPNARKVASACGVPYPKC